jgi:hypothetical protein
MKFAAAVLVLAAAAAAGAQAPGLTGEWRGTITSAAGADTPFVLTISDTRDGPAGSTGGLGATASDVPLTAIAIDGRQVSFRAASDSRLGGVEIAGTLTADGNRLTGAGSIAVGGQRFPATFDLRRRPRPTVTQPQIPQSIDYFVGQWRFEYVGAEYPPVSAGTRAGTVTFTRVAQSSFARGTVQGEVYGDRYEETIDVGFDPDSKGVAWIDRRPDGTELVSVGDWSSPLAITFKTAPVESGGRTYQLRRVLSVRSETAFDVTEELSIDGGPFKRLGNGTYTKQ